MDQYVSWEVAQKANKWQGRNVCRWRNDGVRQAPSARRRRELDPVKRAALFIRMNDIVVQRQLIVIPLSTGRACSGGNLKLVTQRCRAGTTTSGAAATGTAKAAPPEPAASRAAARGATTSSGAC